MGLGAINLCMVNWADAPEKGDCADAIDQGVDVGILIAEAEPLPPPPQLAELLDDLVQYMGRFLVLSPHQRDAVALWIAHTYIFHNADCTPYLNVFSAEKQSGKSRLLEVLTLLLTNPWLISRVTVAAIPRVIDMEHPTILLDEFDAAYKSGREYAEALRGLLDDGFQAGKQSIVCVPPQWNPRKFDLYCPKAIAGIGPLPGTLKDRSIGIEMKRKTHAEPVERFRKKKIKADADLLKDRLEIWTKDTRCYDLDVLLPEELNDREQDIWEILLQLAEEAGGDWPGAGLGFSKYSCPFSAYRF